MKRPLKIEIVEKPDEEAASAADEALEALADAMVDMLIDEARIEAVDLENKGADGVAIPADHEERKSK